MRHRAPKSKSMLAQRGPPIGPRFPAWVSVTLLVAGTVLAYQPAWHAGFIWDDDDYVINNSLLTAPDGLRRIWFSLDSPSQYFPLTYTVLRIEHFFWGLTPSGYHWVNILLHAANALLVWQLLRRLKIPGAWFAAAIFALHPVQVESVAWITEIKSLLSLFFMLLALLTWLAFIENESKRAWRWYALTLICHALALTAKTTACTLPAAFLLMLWLKDKPINRLRLIQIVPFLVMGIGMGLLTVWWERNVQGTRGKLFDMHLLERLLVASRAVWFYLGKLIWPANLIFSYPRWNIDPTKPLAYGWLLAGAGLCGAIFWIRKFVGRGLEVAALFYVSMLSPMLGFIMLYTFLFSFVADHYQYVACIGPVAFAAAGVSSALGKWTKPQCWFMPLTGAIVLPTLGVLSWQQCRMYSDAETLWRTTIARNPASWLARNNLGNILVDQGQIDQGIREFETVIQLNPDYELAYVNLGAAFLSQDRIEEAITQFQTAISLKPDYAEAHSNLGIAFFRQGQIDSAISQQQKATALNPRYAEAHYNLGLAFVSRNQNDKAIEKFQEALRLRPGYTDARNNLGAVLLKGGRIDEAIYQFEEALRLSPGHQDARENLTAALELKSKSNLPAPTPR